MQKRLSSYTVQALADYVSGALTASLDEEIHSLSTLKAAQKGQISFLSNRKYIHQLSLTHASAVLISSEFVDDLPCTGIVVDDPYLAFAKLTHLFDWRQSRSGGVHPTAILSGTCTVESTAYVDAGAVIGEHVHIDAGAYIGPNAVVGDYCKVGQHTRIEAGVVLYNDVHIGQRAIIHSGAVLGADGFGFAKNRAGEWIKICQLAGVRIGNDVEVGAGTTIDRGALEHTYIQDGVKLDNQIQIAHNVVVGENTAIAGCTAVAGSTKIGKNCTIAGLSGITGHLELADHTHITAMTLVSKSVHTPGQVLSSGTGQDLHVNWKKNVVRFKQLNDLAKRVADLEKSK